MKKLLPLLVCLAGVLPAQYVYFADNTINFTGIPPAGWGSPNWAFDSNLYWSKWIPYWSDVSQGNQTTGYEVQLTLAPSGGSLGCGCVWFKAVKHGDNTYSYYSVSLQWDYYVNNGNPLLSVTKVNHNVVTGLASYTVPVPVTGDLLSASLQMSDIGGLSQGINVRYKGTSYYARDVDATMPTIGKTGFSPGGYLSRVQMGTVDSTPPSTVSAASIQGSYAGGSISLQWGASTDNSGGIGMVKYDVYRDGVFQGTTDQTSYAMAASLGTSIVVGIQAWDGHRSFAPVTNKTIVANGPVNPGTGNVDDSRRVGVSSLGSHWGGLGEQIDVRSMNLNFSVPLLTPVGRGGVSAPIALSYNSQNWRKDNGTTWKIGGDVGYGFGWRLAAGSVVPVYDGSTLLYYVFADMTGAEYRLDQNSGNVWRGKDGVYVWYDANTARLWFKNGSFWQMDCISAAQEQDAGTRYPTKVQDTHGNYILLTYQASFGGSNPPNSSSRLVTIEDARAIQINFPSSNPIFRTYQFTYNGNSIPHLTAISNDIQSPEKFSFTYSGDDPLYEPFTGSTQSGTAVKLNTFSVLNEMNLTHTFYYNSSGEMTRTVYPQGGELIWNYITQTFANNRQIREVASRDFKKSSGAAAVNYAFQHPGGVSSLKMHQETTMVDPSGQGRRLWNFSTVNDYREGLELKYEEHDLVSSAWVVKARRESTWAQSANSHKYVSEVLNTVDPGQSYQKQTKSTQAIDDYGNLTTSSVYGYDSLTTPMRTTSCYYLHNSNSNYVPRYLLGLNTFCTSSGSAGAPMPSFEYDLNNPLIHNPADMTGNPRLWTDPQTGYRGLVTAAYSGTTTVYSTYNKGGQPITGGDNSGYSQGTQYGGVGGSMVPTLMTPNNNSAMSTTMNWNGFLGMTSVQGPNGASASLSYTANGLPQSKTSPDGASSNIQYFSNPYYTRVDSPAGWTKTYPDGIGRPIKVERGDANGTKSIVDTEYEPCACSPMGKVKRVSLPYAPGGTVYWTTYTFDGLGRVLTVAQPNGAGTTTNLYQGNTVRVTSPSGKWKQHEMDGLGRLVKVTEPRPGGGTYETTYTYNGLGKLLTVTMPRDGTTQTRSFVYDTLTQSRLQSATNPENGTVNYVYNTDGTLQSKTDAKSIKTEFSYDAYKRVLQMRKLTGNPLVEDRCQRVDYIYDEGTGGVGRLTRTRWGWTVNAQSQEIACPVPGTSSGEVMGFQEVYSYNAAGRILSKALQYWRGSTTLLKTAELKLDWTYNGLGQATSVTYPLRYQQYSSGSGRPVANTTYDTMARLSGLTYTNIPVNAGDPTPSPETVATGAVYDARNALTSLTLLGVVETRQYNTLGQLTRITQPGSIDIEYRFSTTANDGKITSQKNWISGEEVTYLYDELERLSSATTTGPEWGLSWSYDGFGNRLSQSLTKGSGPVSTTLVNPATNRISSAGYSYDSNGNMTAMPQLSSTLEYDASNRLTYVNNTNGGERYAYAPDNRRVWRSNGAGDGFQYGFGEGERIILYSPGGQKMGTYAISYTTGGNPEMRLQPIEENVYWGGRLVYRNRPGAAGSKVVSDRLSSVGDGSTYYPYGEYKSTGSTNGGNDKEQFATYSRDGKTSLDYADQRYYLAGLGTYATTDWSIPRSATKIPQYFNKYSYSGANPTNLIDPLGLEPIDLPPGFELDRIAGLSCIYQNAPEGPAVLIGCTQDKLTLFTRREPDTKADALKQDAPDVHQSWQQTFDCKHNRGETLKYLKDNFSQLASTTFSLQGATHSIQFSGSLAQTGSVLNVTHSITAVGGFNLFQHQSPVEYWYGNDSGFAFSTQPGHPFLPGNIAFRLFDEGGGKLNFQVNVSSQFSNGFWRALYSLGSGQALEDKVWNSLIDRIKEYCK